MVIGTGKGSTVRFVQAGKAHVPPKNPPKVNCVELNKRFHFFRGASKGVFERPAALRLIPAGCVERLVRSPGSPQLNFLNPKATTHYLSARRPGLESQVSPRL